MVKCEICKEKMGETFLNKPLGTCIKDDKGKKRLVCNECQKNLDNDKTKILSELK
ncbi:MAG: hypothetical protein ACMXX5_00635 [Candidatus Woesearchaeota archaeon]